MAYSEEYKLDVAGADGTEVLAAITFDYLKKSQIEVRVSNAGESLSAFKTRLAADSVSALTYPSQYTINDSKVITMASSVLSLGSTYQIEVRRNTGITTNGVDYTDGSTVTEANLDDAQTHLKYLIQEVSDKKATLLEDGSIAANITGDVTGDVTGEADTVTTNADLTGDVTSSGNATSIAAGVIVDADVKSDAAIAYSKLGAIPTWNQDTTGKADTVTTNANLTGGVTSDGNAATVVTNANLTGDVTSSGNATSYAGVVPLIKGGSGQATAQASINALTGASSLITNNYVLTKNADDDAVWAEAPGASGSGETNTASNVESGSGTEVGVFKQKNVADLEFKSLKEGTGITLTENTDDVTITAAAPAAASSSALGSVKLEDDAAQSIEANTVSATASRTYGLQINSAGQGVVNVPWTDTDTNTDTKWDGGTTDLTPATGRTSLGLVIGTDVQAYDADTAKTDAANAWTLPQRTALETDVADGDFDLDVDQNFSCTPGEARLLTFSNPADGQSGYVKLVNAGAYVHTAHGNTKIHADDLTAIGAAGTFLLGYLSDGTDTWVTVSKALA